LIEAAIAALADQEEALRLISTDNNEGDGHRVLLGHVPGLTRLSSGDLPPLLPDASGSLWAFCLRENEDGRELICEAHRAAADQASVIRATEAVLAIAGGRSVEPPKISWTEFSRGHAAAEESDAYRRDYSFWSEMLGRAPTPLLPAERSRARMPARLGTSRGLQAVKTGSLDLPAFEALSAEDKETAAITAFARSIGLDLGSDAVVVERHDPFRRDANDPLGPVGDALPIVITGVLGPASRLAERTRRAIDGARNHRAFDRTAVDSVFERLLTERPIALGEFGFCLVDGVDSGLAEPFLSGESGNSLRLNILGADSGALAQYTFDTDAIDGEQVDRLAHAFTKELAALLGTDAVAWQARPVQRQADSSPVRAHVAAKPPSPQIITSKSGLLPVSMNQRDLISSLADSRTTDIFRRFWVVSRAYWIRPQADLSLLKGVVDGILLRHEALRSRFVLANGEFRIRIDENAASPLVVEDLGDVGEIAALERVRAITETPLDPLNDPLYGVRLLRCGKDGDLLVCLGHHSILDGWSMSVLVEELMAQFFGLPLAPVELGMAEFLTKFEQTHIRPVLERREAYFRRLLADAPEIPNLGRFSKGVAPNLDMVAAGPGAELVVPLSSQAKAALTRTVQDSGASETAMLVASFAETIARQGGVDDTIILIPAAMRTDRKLRNFVGWVATLIPVRAKVAEFASTGALARSIATQIRESMSYLPVGYLKGALRDELTDTGSYMALFNAGMQTVDSVYRGSATAAFHRPGGGEEIDFGPVQIRKVGDDTVRSESVWELDLRSFDSASGHAVRLGYDTLGFTQDEAGSLVSEVLDRLGVRQDSVDLAAQPAAE
ncbi:MAG: condensation domain-containing protein, partial [Alphaproteobacteria bacterium]